VTGKQSALRINGEKKEKGSLRIEGVQSKPRNIERKTRTAEKLRDRKNTRWYVGYKKKGNVRIEELETLIEGVLSERVKPGREGRRN